MKREFTRSSLGLLMWLLLCTTGLAQEDLENAVVNQPGHDNGPAFRFSIEFDNRRQVESPVPEDLPTRFQTLKDPYLKLGSTGDRVRELQATLNNELGGAKQKEENRLIQLPKRIFVGPARGLRNEDDPNTDNKEKVRIVWMDDFEAAFQIRGDWEPLNEEFKNVNDPDDNFYTDLKPTSYIKLPPKPLIVDGIYGQHTQAAVRLFQLENSLPVTGEVDAVTLDKLEPMIPTNPLLQYIMRSIDGSGNFITEPENYPFLLKTRTALIATIVILLASAVVYQLARMLAMSTETLSHWLFTPESSPWFTALKNKRVFLRGALFAPSLFIYAAACMIFPYPDVKDEFPYLTTFQDWHTYVSHLGLAFMSFALTLVALATADAADEVYNPDHETENPISGIIRASKRLIGLLGIILISASFAGKSPFLILGGLGAFMAVILLMFRDYLLGMAASVHIIANRVVKVGDWITMPKYNADGDVMSISLTLIKVQNFDKTISTIPTYAVLSESFRNWTGMQTSGGRRIKRSILIDMQSIQVCTAKQIEKFEQIELIADYIKEKKRELERYNLDHDIDASCVNSRRLTNIGTFRAYVLAYLSQHEGLSRDMSFLARHLQPTSQGLPLEIYAFCQETAWAEYEAVQADIFDHILAVLPEFGLRAFQDISDRSSNIDDVEWDSEQREAMNLLEHEIETANRELAENPRTRVETRMKKLEALMADLDLDGECELVAEDRTIRLCAPVRMG